MSDVPPPLTWLMLLSDRDNISASRLWRIYYKKVGSDWHLLAAQREQPAPPGDNPAHFAHYNRRGIWEFYNDEEEFQRAIIEQLNETQG